VPLPGFFLGQIVARELGGHLPLLSWYRASVSSSSAASESRRQVAATKSAVHASCDALGSTSDASVEAVNAYVEAYNASAPDAAAKAAPAIDSLNTSADSVFSTLSDRLPSDLKTALNGWVDAARQLAGVISRSDGPDAFNGAIQQLNDSKSAARAGCNAAY
jgi:ABC-type transporter Mla subunit MlaD